MSNPFEETYSSTTIADAEYYIDIDPGRKYYFRNINWTGNYIYNEDILNEVLAIKKGDIYDTETLEKKITYNPKGSDVSSLYQDNGYLFSNILFN